MIFLMLMCIQNIVKFCPSILKIWSKNQILMSVKGSFYVANLRKMTVYNPSIDRFNAIAYTEFGLIMSNSSQEIEQKTNSDDIQGPENDASQLRSCQEKVCTKFGFNLSISIRSQEIERKPNCDGMTERKRMTDRVNPV